MRTACFGSGEKIDTQLVFRFGDSRLTAWADFHRDNPAVWELFVRFSREARGSRDRFGARIVWERLRWYTTIETNDAAFKLSNNHTPYYARLLMLAYPDEFAGFFSTKDAKFEGTADELLRAHARAERAWRLTV